MLPNCLKTVVLRANLRYLLAELPHGSKQVLAHELGVHGSTLSRWLQGGQRPSQKNMDAIKAYCQLPAGVDLRKDPLFLSLTPLSQQQQRAWLIQRIEQLDAETLHRLFPALERLLRE